MQQVVLQSLERIPPFILTVCIQNKLSTEDANPKISGSKYELRD